MFKTLYKKTTNGLIQQWSIFVNIENNSYWTEEGIVNGKITKSKPTKVEDKHIGKSNHVSAEEQVYLEAQRKYIKKLENSYVENIEDIDNKKLIPDVMLAHKYEDYKQLLFTVPTYIQPKLDGIRSKTINFNTVKSIELLTRNNKPIISCLHIVEELERLKLYLKSRNIDWNISLLDGELYTHEYKNNFNELVSIIKKIKPTEKDLEKSKIIEYHLYDIIENNVSVFSERNELLIQLRKEINWISNIKLVPTYKIRTIEELQFYAKSFLEQGYEGSIIRLDLGNYEQKRSKQLLKYKSFIDEEFEIADIIEGVGNRTDVAGYIILYLDNTKTTTFKSNIKGTFEYYKELLENKQEYIGKLATIKYFERTPDNIPRFPVCVGIRDYE